jgi:SOS-response transcriptional repressor LexA
MRVGFTDYRAKHDPLPVTFLREGYICPMNRGAPLVCRNVEFLIRVIAQSNPNDMAKKLHLAQPTLHRLIKGEATTPSTATLEKIRNYFALPSVDVLLNVDLSQIHASGMPLTGDNIEAVTGSRRRVPVISWQKAAKMHRFTEILPGDTLGYVFPVEATHVPNPFALRVKGDSMSGATGASFPEGSVVIFDPSLVAVSGDYVLALDPTTSEPTFKRLIEDAGRWFLRPLNPSYPTVQFPDPFGVIAVAVECQQITNLRNGK